MKEFSRLHLKRMEYKPRLPQALRSIAKVALKKTSQRASHPTSLASLFPHTWAQPLLGFETLKHEKIGEPLRIGVVFSGGQAPGGHNVIAGIFDAIKEIHPESALFGFWGGPSGIIEGKSCEITADLLHPFRNQGGFDLIGSGRTKIETEEQMKSALAMCQKLKIQGLVVIGGDDSNTNAAFLAEYFAGKKADISVVGVPKTIDGDLRNEHIEISFGFDTACKIYSELIGNIARDALSAKKYYHFIRLMGRSASHITLECALAARPNLALISEEIAKEKKTLKDIVNQIADLISERSRQKKEYGVILIPEGVIEFLPEMKILFRELNSLLAEGSPFSKKMDALEIPVEKTSLLGKELTEHSRDVFFLLPQLIQEQLLLDRDPHGNVQVSKIETERLLVSLVTKELKKRKEERSYKGKFNAVEHFLGYEGRCGMPSNFDAQYCYSLGFTSALLIREKANGYIATIGRLRDSVDQWEPKGVPIASLFTLEERQGKTKPVIKKALVELEGGPFSYFQKMRLSWQIEDHFLYPGPIQFAGGEELTDNIPYILQF